MAKLNYLNVVQGTDEWLEQRRKGITASEMPILTGNRKGLMELWAYKTGVVESNQPTDPNLKEMFSIGPKVEPIIARGYTEKTGRVLRRVNRMVHADEPTWAYASLDRIVIDHSRIVELKWAAIKRWDEVPLYVMDQVQWQMFVTGIGLCDVAVLNGGRVEIHEIKADKSYQDDLLAIALDFKRHVENNEPPPADGMDGTGRIIAKMYPQEATDSMITEPDQYLSKIVNELRIARQNLAVAEEQDGLWTNRLKMALGDSSGVKVGKHVVTWRKNRDTTTVDYESIAAKYLASLPTYEALALKESFTRTLVGNRVLRARFADDDDGVLI